MKKIILGIAIVTASMFSVNASAQNTDKNANRPGREMMKAMNPFEGLNLTAQQQEALKAIPNPWMQAKADKKKDKEAKKEAKRQDRMQAMEEAKANRTKYLAEVKKVLTPEQYVQFLENSYVNRPMMPMRPGKDGMKGMKNDQKRGNRHNG